MEMGLGTQKAGDQMLTIPQHGRSSSPQHAPELHFQVQKTEAGGWPDKGSATNALERTGADAKELGRTGEAAAAD